MLIFGGPCGRAEGLGADMGYVNIVGTGKGELGWGQKMMMLILELGSFGTDIGYVNIVGVEGLGRDWDVKGAGGGGLFSKSTF